MATNVITNYNCDKTFYSAAYNNGHQRRTEIMYIKCDVLKTGENVFCSKFFVIIL